MGAADDLASSTQYLVNSLLREGIALAHAGEKERARELFRHIIQLDPEQEEAWVWLAWVAESREDSRRYLQEARALLPNSVRIVEALRWSADATTEAPREPGAFAKSSLASGAPPSSGLHGQAAASVQAASTEVGKTFRFLLGKAVAAPRRLARTTSVAGARVRDFNARRPPIEALRPYLLTAGLVAMVVAFVAIAVVGVADARAKNLQVRAEVLPTPDPNAAALAVAEPDLAELWRKAELAMAVGKWDEAVTPLQSIRTLAPEDDQARKQLSLAYYNQALQALEANSLQEARALFDQAIRVDASNQDLQRERRLLALYMDGLEAYWAQEWDVVVSKLAKLNEARPDYLDTKAMLGEGYYQRGLRLQSERQWYEAKEAMQRCLELVPEHPYAPQRIAEIDLAITPPRRIEVSLSQFTCTVYEDNKPIRVFTVCHGRKSAPTLPGRYEIKSKLPSAYGPQWEIDMPYWLGIYDAGTVENGFHGLPILKNGQRMWAGALGTRCSYGCIVLGTADAEFLWNWADIGTVVFIRE